MNKESAIQLLENTFGDSFNKEKFSRFVKEVFNNFDLTPKNWRVWNEYEDYIDSLELLGTFEHKKHTIDVLVVKLKKSTSIEKARTMQRNFVAKYLANMEKDAALVAFYYDGDPDWRFSFVKMEYRLKENIKGKTKIEREITPAKRYSFLVGKNEPNHTCKRQFLELVMEEEDIVSLESLESAFSIEKVTNEFFNEYKELYLELKESLDRVLQKDSLIRKEFEGKGISSVDFSKKLLGQIVFIYFLQKKGWLGVHKLEPWGSGPKNFLRKLFNKEVIRYENFFNDVLEPLFYDALATSQRDEEYYTLFDCKIPFLNGGLFEPIENYNWVATDIFLDNSIFKKILDTFDRYNFTIKEDEPLEKEVAIDPEMLGKVFENLLEIKDRKSKGSYYTPREIVHHMCQQSLINYLETNTGISREDIEKFIEFGEIAETKEKLPDSIIDNIGKIDSLLKNVKIVDPAVGSGAFPVGMMSEIVKARSFLTQFFPENERTKRTNYNLKRETIENCLYGVDIDSSAVDIAKLRFWLSLIVDEIDMQNIKPLPNLDHKIMVGNSLLEEFEGVKLFDESILGESKRNGHEVKRINEEMSKIYLELGEIHKGLRKHDSNRVKEIHKELKNLKLKKRKLLYANKNTETQITIEDSLTNRIKQSKIKLGRLKELQKLFFNEQDRNLKKQYAEQIDRIEWELIEETLKEQGNEEDVNKLIQYKKSRSKPFFIWKLYFSEVFQGDNPGFDIVIGNPPYVSHDKIQEKTILKNKFTSYEPFADLYCYFIEAGLNIQKQKGLLCYITSNSYLRTKYGRPLRRLLMRSSYIMSIINIEDYQLFDTAIVNTAVLLTKKKNESKDTPSCLIVNASYLGKENFSEFIEQNKFEYQQDDFEEESWSLIPRKQLKLKRKIEDAGNSLESYHTKIRLGIATGLNEVFMIDGETKAKLIKKDSKNRNIIKPVLRGRDIFRYKYEFNDTYLLLTKNGIDVKKDYPVVYEYLNSFGPKFKKRGAQGGHWSNLRACSFLDDFKKEKIIWIELTDNGRFALSTEEMYLLNSAYFLIPPPELLPKYLLAILNSKLMEFYLSVTAETSGMGVKRWINNFVKEFPIPNILKEKQGVFVKLVDEILKITKDKDYLENLAKKSIVSKYEKQIDTFVYKLYELTPDDIKIIEGSNIEQH